MNTKIFSIILAVIVVGGSFYILWSKPVNAPSQTACTMEAKICPDGSAVGRTGPNCQFAACPAVVANSASGITGSVLLGPTCPVERNPPDPACADKPYQGNFVIMTADGSKVVTNFSSDSAGTFKVKVAPGEYSIRSAPSANMLPRCSSNGTIIVKANSYTTANISCDSGIR